MNEVQKYVMKRRVDSRGPLVDTELCTKMVGDARFDLVLIASERLREMRRQHKDSGKYITPVEALLEIQAGNVDPVAYLAKIRDRREKENKPY
jgi:DNA-directed RNA polymerase subunit K/omega